MPSKTRDYNDPNYKKWRKAVLVRDDFRCQMCPKDDTNPRGRKDLEVHHIKKWADATHLRNTISNGISLCKKCHVSITGEEEKWEEMLTNKVRTLTEAYKTKTTRFKKPKFRIRRF